MKKTVCFIAILFFTVPLFASRDKTPLYDSFTLSQLYYPVDEGSENQDKLVEYLEQFCSTRGASYTVEKIASGEYVTNSYNFIVRFPGSIKDGEKRVFIFPLNSTRIQQQLCSCALSTYVALAMIDLCSKKRFMKDVVIIFSGANGRENERLYGIDHLFLYNKDILQNSLVTIVDIISSYERIVYSGSINKKPLPAGLLELFIKSNPDDKNFTFDYSSVRKARLNLLKQRKDIEPFLELEIPAVSFSNVDIEAEMDYVFNEENERNVKDYFLSWLSLVASTPLEKEKDYNYLYLGIIGVKLIIPEYFQILFFVTALFLLIFLRGIFLYFNRMKIKLLIRVLPFFFILFCFFYATSFIPRIILLPFEYLTGDQNISNNIPSLYFIIIFCTPVILGLIMSKKIKKLPFPKHNFLFIYGAVLSCYFNFFVFTVIDFSIAYMFVWAIIFLTLSHVIGKQIVMKYLLYLLSTIPFILLYIELSLMGNISLLRRTFDFPLRQHMLFSLLAFPFFLLILRIELLTRLKFKKMFPSKTIFITVLSITLAVTLLLYTLISAYVEPEPQPLRVEYRLDIDEYNKDRAYLTYKGGSGNDGWILVDEYDRVKKYPIDSTRETIEIKRLPMPFYYKLTGQKGDIRTRYTLSLASDSLIDTVALFIICPENANPLDSNYAIKKVLDQDVVRKYCGNAANCQIYKLLIPRNSGREIDIMIELLSGENYTLQLEVDYPFSFPGNSISISSPATLVYTKSRIIKKFYIQ